MSCQKSRTGRWRQTPRTWSAPPRTPNRICWPRCATRDSDLATSCSSTSVSTRWGPLPRRPPRSAPSARGAMLLRVLRDVVGDTGTLVFPAYTFSFCRQERFDLDRSPTVGGDWSTSADVLEYARRSPGAVRSRDPIHSAVGARTGRGGVDEGPAVHLLRRRQPSASSAARRREDLPDRHRRARSVDGAARRGDVEGPVPLQEAVHGRDRGAGERAPREGWIYDVRVRCPNTDARPRAHRARGDEARRDAERRRSAATRFTCWTRSRSTTSCATEIAADPWFTVKGPPVADLVALERMRVAPARLRRTRRAPPCASAGCADGGDRQGTVDGAARHRVGWIRRRAVGARDAGADADARVSDGHGVLHVDRAGEVDVPRGVAGDAGWAAAVLV